MSRSRIIPLVAALVVVSLAVWLIWSDRSSTGFVLLTAEEQTDFMRNPDELHRELKVSSSEGPNIQVSAPKGFSLVSPVDFDIRVEPRNGVAVNMKSIKIEYRIGPAWVNMTNRILKYASIKGSRLYARGAELPPGKHALRVSVNDAQNRVTQATVSFTVER